LNSKKVVVKIGTKLLAKNSSFNMNFMESISRSIKSLQQEGHQILIVSSGATYIGKIEFNFTNSDKTIEQQIYAACGQPLLIDAWRNAAGQAGLNVAQFLLTQEDIFFRKRFLYVREVLQYLLNQGIIPIVNENDAVAIQGSTFGENDLLAAKTAVSLFPSDLLILLCEQEGVFTCNPDYNPDAQLITNVESGEILEGCNFSASEGISRGGMSAKIRAALLASRCGVRTVIANGKHKNIIEDIIHGKQMGTVFPEHNPIVGYKSWLMMQEPVGSIVVNPGAKKAIKEGGSLLPVGIINCQGDFFGGDTVRIVSDNQNVAIGITNYSSAEISLLSGRHSSDIDVILGHNNGAEVVHRSKMVCL